MKKLLVLIGLFLSALSWATPTLVQTVKGTLTGNGSATITSTGSGNMLVVGLAVTDNVSRTLVGGTQFWTVADGGDTATKAWTDSLAPDTGTFFLASACFSNIASGRTSVTFTFGTGSGAPTIYIIQEWSGVTSSPFDKTDGAVTGSTTNPTSGSSGTLSQASELVIGLACDSTSTVPTAGSGYSNLATQTSSTNYLAMESKVVSATTAVTAVFTDSTVSSWAAAVTTYKASAAAAAAKGGTMPLLGAG